MSTLKMDSTSPLERNFLTGSKWDWKLGPNVRVKIVLEKLECQSVRAEDFPVSSDSTNPDTAASPTPKCVQRKCTAMSKSGSPAEHLNFATGRDLNSPAIYQEPVQEVILQFEPDCNICCNFVHQLTQHFHGLHGPPSTDCSIISPVSATVDVETHLGSNRITSPLPLHIGQIPASSDLRETENGSKIEVSGTNQRRMDGSQTATMKFTDETDIPSITASDVTTTKYVRCEPGEIKICDNAESPNNLDDVSDSDNGSEFGNDGSDSDFALEDNTAACEQTCCICRVKLNNVKELSEHMRSTHQDVLKKPYKCMVCENEISFCSSFDLDKHFQRVHPSCYCLPFACKNCGKRFFEELDLDSHLLTHNEENSYMCDHCNKGFKSTIWLENHFNIIHPKEKLFKCEACEKNYYTKEYLSEHEKLHKENQNTIDLTSEIQSTIDNSSREYQIACAICERAFENSDSIKRHMRKKHRDILQREPSRVCKYCDNRFLSNNELIIHVQKSHPGYRAFECKVCYKGFYTHEELSNHYKILHRPQRNDKN